MSSRDVYSQIIEKRAALVTRVNNRKIRLSFYAFNLENILRAGTEEESWNARSSNSASFKRELNSYNLLKDDYTLTTFVIEFHRKFAVPFGAFCFVFLAVTLGLMAKKSGQTVGFLFGNIISVIYWSMLFIGQTMGLRIGTPPFWSMWLPNIITALAGIILMFVRVRR
jgi:lipopolysaccharide export system permease protein